MKRLIKAPLVLILLALPLAGCGDDGDDEGADGRDPQERFGGTFASAFNADEGADPIDPEPGDAGTLSLVDDPVDF